jgi:hypothetical protein
MPQRPPETPDEMPREEELLAHALVIPFVMVMLHELVNRSP